MKKDKADNNTKDNPPEPLPDDESPPAKAASRGVWTLLQNLAASRSLFIFCAILLPVIALANFPTYRALQDDYDLWFHLAYGREYVQNLSWSIDHSQFSWTPAQAEWLYPWLGSFMLYFVYSLAGIHGLFVFLYMMMGVSAGAILLMAHASAVRPGLWLLTAFLVAAISVCFSGPYIKPEMFSILLTTLTTIVCLRFRMNPGAWIIAVLPLIFFIWVNTHGLWFFGLAFVGLFLVMSILEHFLLPKQGMNKKNILWLAAGTVLAVLVLAINPDGIAYPAQVFLWIVFPDDIEFIRQITAHDSMWVHLLYAGKYHWTIHAWTLLTMFLVFAGAWLLAWKRTNQADLPVAAANIVFFLLGMYMVRLTLVYTMIWLPSMVYMAWRLGQTPKPSFPRVGPLILAAFLLLTGLTAAKVALFDEDRRWLGFGYQDYMPVKEVAFIKLNNLPGPVFNSSALGAYMMWAIYPDYKVFIDPRHTPYYDQVYPDYKGIGTKYPYDRQGFEAFTEKYPARIALIQHKYTNIIGWFLNSPDWYLAYFDKNAAVLLHREIRVNLRPEDHAALLSPERYKDTSNPRVLREVFTYYHFLGPDLAAVIRDYYQQNVSNLYLYKKQTLDRMDNALTGGRQ